MQDAGVVVGASMECEQVVQAAVRSRDEFLSVAAHELRSPIAAIRTIAQSLRRARERGVLDDERLDRALGHIDDASSRLSTLTGDLLELTRLQSELCSLNLEPVAVAELARESVDLCRARFPSADLALVVPRGAVDGAGLALGDWAYLGQALQRLLTNAVAYSPDGGRISVVVREADAPVTTTRTEAGIRGAAARPRPGLLVEVRDQGIGIPAGAEEEIFAPFKRGVNALQRHIEGSGLGLCVCRAIAERHGGRLWATSVGEGRGATFSLWLPVAGRAAEAA